jgi:hypothetical protein
MPSSKRFNLFGNDLINVTFFAQTPKMSCSLQRCMLEHLVVVKILQVFHFCEAQKSAYIHRPILLSWGEKINTDSGQRTMSGETDHAGMELPPIAPTELRNLRSRSFELFLLVLHHGHLRRGDPATVCSHFDTSPLFYTSCRNAHLMTTKKKHSIYTAAFLHGMGVGNFISLILFYLKFELLNVLLFYDFYRPIYKICNIIFIVGLIECSVKC